MPKARGGGGLGLGLGLSKKGQGAFTTAMSGGQDAFTAYMQSHPNITKQLGGLEGKRAATAQGQNWAAMTKQYGINPVRPAAPGAPAAPAPIAPAPPPAAAADPNWYSKFVSNYELPMPKEL